MKKTYKTKKLVGFLFIFSLFSINLFAKTPRLTVVFIVDQFAYHYLYKIEPFLSGGIHFLLNNGVVYKNAYMPHANPATSSGHVTINTGVYPKDHGIIGNYWLNKAGKQEQYEKNDIGSQQTMSPKNIMVNGITDQFILNSQPTKIHKAFALSHKSRAAIGMAGKLGKAIWFDHKERQFVSSKSYFKKQPKWLKTFNNKHLAPAIPKAVIWKLFHPQKKLAYNFYNATDYSFAGHPFSLIENPFNKIKHKPKSKYDELYIKSPHANQHLLDLAKQCLDHNFNPKSNENMLLWISLSPLDPLGHYYGPESRETIDMLYHLDWQIAQFMKHIHSILNQNDILYLLTADHGVMPIIELLQKRGFGGIYRINATKLTIELNKLIEKKHGVANVISTFLTPQFYLNKAVFNTLPQSKMQQITKTIKTFLEKQPGIEKVWTYDELDHAVFDEDSINSWYKNQLYPGRSGEFICKCKPYTAITKYPTGTHHRTPYEYDTHVPLAIYQKQTTKRKTIEKTVFSTQIANTLAKMLNITKPSASTFDPLPGI